ncbi:ABC transporter substrate-binding protein [Cupriavidus sp. WS]|uniref:ABC transporter substrate-binding protein n=1 Tax=Cupriavidus sp. WS TaxID=1312922 RepID=UPI0003622DD8|nr:ABC transporter substrate-binding protein [Cupriavidus sp. WS]
MKFSQLIRMSACALGLAMSAAGASAATPIRVGYWTSGVSLGFGAVMEAQKQLQARGFEPEFVYFPDVNGPTKAIAANTIDLAFGASLAGAFSLGDQGVPVKIILATQIVEAEFVVPADSPIKTMADLKGKKIGMAPTGSATTSVGTATLQANHGLSPKDYSFVPGNESRLVQFVLQKDVDAAALRSTTIAQLGHDAGKLRTLATFRDEWQTMTKSKSLPYIGVAIMRDDWMKKYPDGAARAVAAMRDTLNFGARNGAAVVEILKKAGNLPESGARMYADRWLGMNAVSLEPADIDTLKRTFDIFKAEGILKGNMPADIFLARPYNDAKALK